MLQIINASRWHSFTEKGVTLFSVSMQPKGLVPIDCNTSSAFAWLLYDENKQEITAARDYIGLEPFFYCYQNQTFIFGSSIHDVIQKLPKFPELNVCRLLEECFHDHEVMMTRYSNETHYHGIFRVEAGSRLYVKNKKLSEEKYWTFDKGRDTIYYSKEQDYLDHFGELLSKALLPQIQNHHKPACEYSGGLDSTLLLALCHQHQINLPLFCHIAEPGQNGGDFSFAECVIEHLNCQDVHYVDAQNLDLETVFQDLAQIYAGVPPYIYPIMSINIYQSIKQYGCNRIISGFGGDQCVSSHASGQPFYFELLQKNNFSQVLREYSKIYPKLSRIQAILNLLRFKHPTLHNMLHQLGDIKSVITSYLDKKAYVRRYVTQHYKSVREMQLDLLEGKLCHEVRSRVEYSAILGKVMGFSHIYPLLNPDVVDFALRLPTKYKQRDGEGRYLVRKYLAQYVPEKNYTQKKRHGAHIMPAMMNRCTNMVKENQLPDLIQSLPFAKKIHSANSFHSQLRHAIFAYMLNGYLDRNLRS